MNRSIIQLICLVPLSAACGDPSSEASEAFDTDGSVEDTAAMLDSAEPSEGEAGSGGVGGSDDGGESGSSDGSGGSSGSQELRAPPDGGGGRQPTPVS